MSMHRHHISASFKPCGMPLPSACNTTQLSMPRTTRPHVTYSLVLGVITRHLPPLALSSLLPPLCLARQIAPSVGSCHLPPQDFERSKDALSPPCALGGRLPTLPCSVQLKLLQKAGSSSLPSAQSFCPLHKPSGKRQPWPDGQDTCPEEARSFITTMLMIRMGVGLKVWGLEHRTCATLRLS